MDAMFRVAFNEDKEILEAIQLEENKVPLHRPVRLAIDKGRTYTARASSGCSTRKNRRAELPEFASEGKGSFRS
jgi:hypothetical protein